MAPLVHEALHSVRDRGRDGGLASKGFLREEVVEGGGNGVQVLDPLDLDVCLGEDLHPRERTIQSPKFCLVDDLPLS